MLRHPVLEGFFSQAGTRVYRQKSLIVHPADQITDVFLVVRGYVKSYHLTVSGQEQQNMYYGPGHLLNINYHGSLISEMICYEAIDNVEISRRNRDDFLHFIKNSQAATLELLALTCEYTDALTARIFSLSYLSAPTRVLSRLLFLGRRFGRTEGNTSRILIPFTHQDFATSICMTRETASRELKRLQDQGLVKYQSRKLTLLDIRRLGTELQNYQGDVSSMLSHPNNENSANASPEPENRIPMSAGSRNKSS